MRLTLNAEHDLYRWGPITQAPSLLDGDGGFPRTVTDVWDHADLDEVRRECRAQVERAVLWGFDISHLDAHLDALLLRPEFFDVYLELALDFGLPLRLPDDAVEPNVGFPIRQLAAEEGVLFADRAVTVPPSGGREALLDALGSLEPGVTEITLHPAVDSRRAAGRHGGLGVPGGRPRPAGRATRRWPRPWTPPAPPVIGYRPLRDAMRSTPPPVTTATRARRARSARPAPARSPSPGSSCSTPTATTPPRRLDHRRRRRHRRRPPPGRVAPGPPVGVGRGPRRRTVGRRGHPRVVGRARPSPPDAPGAGAGGAGDTLLADGRPTGRLPHAEAGALISIQTRTGTYRFLRSGGDPTDLAARIGAFAVRHRGPAGLSTVTTVAARPGCGGPHRTGWARVQPWLVVLLVVVVVAAVTLILLQSAGVVHLPFLGGGASSAPRPAPAGRRASRPARTRSGRPPRPAVPGRRRCRPGPAGRAAAPWPRPPSSGPA